MVLTGGIESMSQAPHVIRGLRSGLRLGQGQLEDTLWSALLDTHCGCTMAATAENCAAKYGVSREAQDEYAMRSQQLAARAWGEGRFDDEVVPVELKTRKETEVFAPAMTTMQSETTMDVLAKLPAAFSKNGCVTAGNASGIVDGGAAFILASETAVRGSALKPLARLTTWATVGVDPALMGMGRRQRRGSSSRRRALTLGRHQSHRDQRGVRGAVPRIKDLGLDRERVNVNGGAITLGHPLGMTGTRLLLTLALELRRRGLKRGLAAACIGGGQGIAAIVET